MVGHQPLRVTLGRGTWRRAALISADDRRTLPPDLLVAVDRAERLTDVPVPLTLASGDVIALHGDLDGCHGAGALDHRATRDLVRPRRLAARDRDEPTRRLGVDDLAAPHAPRHRNGDLRPRDRRGDRQPGSAGRTNRSAAQVHRLDRCRRGRRHAIRRERPGDLLGCARGGTHRARALAESIDARRRRRPPRRRLTVDRGTGGAPSVVAHRPGGPRRRVRGGPVLDPAVGTVGRGTTRPAGDRTPVGGRGARPGAGGDDRLVGGRNRRRRSGARRSARPDRRDDRIGQERTPAHARGRDGGRGQPRAPELRARRLQGGRHVRHLRSAPSRRRRRHRPRARASPNVSS